MGTIGIDFGTHQTKICYEDRSDKTRPRYTFFKFPDLNGKVQIILPSVVQINNDDTLSYGFVDESKCKYDCILNCGAKPKEPSLLKPELVIPDKPKKPKLPPKPKSKLQDWKEKLFALTMNKGEDPLMLKWESECQNIERSYSYEIEKWNIECSYKKRDFEQRLLNYNTSYEDYQRKLKAWEDKYNHKEKMVFRYFKQATFADLEWKSSVSPTMLSIWYLSYILFDLEREYNTDFSTQMGIPTGAERFEKNKQRAVSILLSAFYLVEEVFHGDKLKFLATKYDDLLQLTKWQQYSEESKYNMGILVFPEAYASLRSLTTKGRLESGMNLMVDIGGGTTDISFFVIDVYSKTYEPLIYSFHSISKGINYIVETAAGGNKNMTSHFSLDSKDIDKNNLEEAKKKYSSEVNEVCKKLIETLYRNFIEKKRSRSDLAKALTDRPIVYTGGGSTFDNMRNGIEGFNQIRHMGGHYWKGMVIDNMDELDNQGLCPILSVALGLSVAQDDDNVKIHPIHHLFNHISTIQKEDRGIEGDYLLFDD